VKRIYRGMGVLDLRLSACSLKVFEIKILLTSRRNSDVFVIHILPQHIKVISINK
jgi:hypothetical protein